MDRATQADIADFAAKMGPKRTSTFLSNMGKRQQFINALTSPIGVELMKVVIKGCDKALDKIINEKADEAVRAEYRVWKEIAETWARKVAEFEKGHQDIIKRART